jgi:hypothetical protein
MSEQLQELILWLLKWSCVLMAAGLLLRFIFRWG